MIDKPRIMVFVDGTNLLVRLSKELEIDFRADTPPVSALELANDLVNSRTGIRGEVIRRYWFASYKGSEEYWLSLSKELRRLHFEPVLFRKRRGREKGVDIALTKEL